MNSISTKSRWGGASRPLTGPTLCSRCPVDGWPTGLAHVSYSAFPWLGGRSLRQPLACPITPHRLGSLGSYLGWAKRPLFRPAPARWYVGCPRATELLGKAFSTRAHVSARRSPLFLWSF